MLLFLLFSNAMSTAGAMLQVAAPARPPGGRRVADAEVQRRLRLVEGLLAEGRSRTEMAAVTGLPLRTLDSYAKRVRSRWQRVAQTDSRDARERALDRLMALREHLFEARAWGPLVRVEQLLCELEGAWTPTAETSAPPIAPPPLAAESLRERGPLIVRACARLALNSGDGRLREMMRDALASAAEEFTEEAL